MSAEPLAIAEARAKRERERQQQLAQAEKEVVKGAIAERSKNPDCGCQTCRAVDALLKLRGEP